MADKNMNDEVEVLRMRSEIARLTELCALYKEKHHEALTIARRYAWAFAQHCQYNTDETKAEADKCYADLAAALCAAKSSDAPAPAQDEQAWFERWAEKKYPMAVCNHSLGAYTRSMKKCAEEAWMARAELRDGAK